MSLPKKAIVSAFIVIGVGLLANCSGKPPAEKATNAVVASMYAQKGDAIEGGKFDAPHNKGDSSYQIEVEEVLHNTERKKKNTVIRYIVVRKGYPTWAPRCGRAHQYEL